MHHHGVPIEQAPPVAIIVLFALFFLAVLLLLLRNALLIRRSRNRSLVNRKNDTRISALSDWAKSRDLSFSPDNDTKLANRFWFFDRLKLGDSNYGYNIMEGVIGSLKICAFDYNAEPGRTPSEPSENCSWHAQTFSAVIVETSAYFRPLFIRTEKFRDKIAASAGLEDIDFESTEFNSQFYVRASDRRWAYNAVNQATMELLLNYCRFNIEFNGKYIIAYRDELFELGHFEEALQLLTGIIGNLPKTLFGKEKGEKLWS